MKIYFSASQRGKKFFEKYYTIIYDEIQKLGHTNLDDDIIKFSSEQYYQKIESEGRKAYVALYKKKVKNVQKADICIFECSLHSLSMGYQIEKSLEMNTPVVVLYYKNNIPFFLSGEENEKLIVKQYNDDNIKTVLQKAIDDAHKTLETRFNFLITPSLLNYLEKASKMRGITRSTFIRNLILDHMHRHGN